MLLSLLLVTLLFGATHVSPRGLQQQDSTGPRFTVFFGQGPVSALGLTRSEGISNLGSWVGNAVFNFTCTGPDNQPYVVGPANPELCVEQTEVTMSSELFGNVTVAFDADQLSELRSVNPTDPTQYVWGLPLNKYAVPNAYYEGISFNVTFSEDGSLTGEIPSVIVNQFNASAASLREYYGVDPSLQGSKETVQGSVLYFGQGIGAVNTTAASEYLALQGLVPNVPLQISDWAPKNKLSACAGGDPDDNCGESQLDVETQQAFAPQAVTFFAPTEDLSLSPAAVKAYFLAFVNNVTSAEERVQVVSLSWNTDYTDGIGDFKVFEDALKKLTLSGITVRV